MRKYYTYNKLYFVEIDNQPIILDLFSTFRPSVYADELSSQLCSIAVTSTDKAELFSHTLASNSTLDYSDSTVFLYLCPSLTYLCLQLNYFPNMHPLPLYGLDNQTAYGPDGFISASLKNCALMLTL